MSVVFSLTARELCNVSFAMMTARMDQEQAERFVSYLRDPDAFQAVGELRAAGVA